MSPIDAGRPLKVALFVHYFFPEHFYGTEAYTLLVARGLQALGHEPVVVTATGSDEPPQASFVERYEWEGVPVWRVDKTLFPVREILDTYEQPAMREVHERLLRALQPDLVHVTHLINHTASLLEVTAALGIPTFATLTDFFGFCFNNRLQAADGRLCGGPNGARSNCTACYLKDAAAAPWASAKLKAANRPLVRRLVAETVARTAGPDGRAFGIRVDDLKRRPGLLRERYRIYRAMVAPTRFLRDAYAANGFEAPLVLSRFGIDIDRSPKPPRPDPERVRLAFVGQMAPHKGPHLLLEALKAVGSPRLSVDLWGSESQDPAYAAKLRGLAEGLPMRFRGTFPSAETAALMAGTDVLVIPSTWYENSPLILLQALATHTPVIVADVQGLTEFVEEGRSGLVFARGDADALASALRRFAEDPALAERMSATTVYARTPVDMVADLVQTWRSYAPELFDRFADESGTALRFIDVDEVRGDPGVELRPLDAAGVLLRPQAVGVEDFSESGTPHIFHFAFEQNVSAKALAAFGPQAEARGSMLLRLPGNRLHLPRNGGTEDTRGFVEYLRSLPESSRDARFHSGLRWSETGEIELDEVEPVVLPGDVFWATADEPYNYGVWLLQTLPAVARAEREGLDCSLLCHAPLAWQQEILRRAAPRLFERLVQQDLELAYRAAGRLWTVVQDRRNFVVTPSEASVVDDIVTSALERCGAATPERIFVSRLSRSKSAPGYRTLLNEEALAEAMREEGFAVVEPESLPFLEQVALFARARYVVGPGGAGLFNAVFCRPGTTVLTIESSNSWVDAHANIFASRGLNYAVAFGRQEADDPGPQKRWTVPVDAVIDMVRRVDPAQATAAA